MKECEDYNINYHQSWNLFQDEYNMLYFKILWRILIEAFYEAKMELKLSIVNDIVNGFFVKVIDTEFIRFEHTGTQTFHNILMFLCEEATASDVPINDWAV